MKFKFQGINRDQYLTIPQMWIQVIVKHRLQIIVFLCLNLSFFIFSDNSKTIKKINKKILRLYILVLKIIKLNQFTLLKFYRIQATKNLIL